MFFVSRYCNAGCWGGCINEPKKGFKSKTLFSIGRINFIWYFSWFALGWRSRAIDLGPLVVHWKKS